jgi:membrane associated rhomboid family serine protease
MLNMTPVVRNLIIINVVVFLLQSLMPSLTNLLSLYKINSGYWAPYQFFTYMFAHGGFGHIFFNMLALAFMAPILEQYWGSKRFLTFYIIVGIGSGVIYELAEYLVVPDQTQGMMLGASGAVYGVLMAFGMMFPNMEVMLLFPPIPVKAKYLVFIIGAITYMTDRSGSVAHMAHLGGILVAYFLITFWRKR